MELKRNKLLKISCILTLVFSIAMFIAFGNLSDGNDNSIDYSLDENKIALSSDVEISSRSVGLFNNDYNATITFNICNMTDRPVYDILLYFYVAKKDGTNFKMLTATNKVSLAANEEKNVTFYFDTDENYSEIKSVKAKIGYGRQFDVKNEDDFADLGGGATACLVLAIISLVAFQVLFVINIIRRVRNNIMRKRAYLQRLEQEKLNAARKTGDQAEIDRLAAELHKEQLKAKIKALKDPIIVCEYCKTSNSKENQFCTSCGAPLEKN